MSTTALLPVSVKPVLTRVPTLNLCNSGGWSMGFPPSTSATWLAGCCAVFNADAGSFDLATQPVDMCTDINDLALHVQQVMGRVPWDGTAYVFSNRRLHDPFQAHPAQVCQNLLHASPPRPPRRDSSVWFTHLNQDGCRCR